MACTLPHMAGRDRQGAAAQDCARPVLSASRHLSGGDRLAPPDAHHRPGVPHRPGGRRGARVDGHAVGARARHTCPRDL
eukprot:1548146-Prymnesium_polylepis.1